MLAHVPGRVVIFRVAAQYYALDVMAIERVIRYVAPRTIPMASNDFSGVIDVEGRLVPVVDLRDRFGGEAGSANGRVLLVSDAGSVMGFVVDQVLEVRSVEASDVEPAPTAMVKGDGPVVFLGTIRRGGDVVLLVEVGALLAATRPATASVA